MITRVYRGSDTGGLVAYLYGPGRHEEHRDQRLVACWDGNEVLLEPTDFDAAALDAAQLRQHALGIARTLDVPVAACETVPEYVYHLVMRNGADDPVLSDAQWAEIGRDAMDRTGIAPRGDDLGCRWALIRHGDDHVHLVATLARQDGRRPRIYRDFLRLRELAHDWEQRLGLAVTAPADNTAAVGATIGETKKAERLRAASAPSKQRGKAGQRTHGGAGEPPSRSPQTPRQQLARAVHAAAARSEGLDGFRAMLAGAGVEVHERMSETAPGQVTGLSFSMAGHVDREGNPIRYGGSKLAPDLSWPKLAARWGLTSHGQPVAEPDANTAANDANEEAGRPPKPGFFEEATWQEAERIVREAAEAIAADGVQDPADAADAVWAASDTLRSLAWAVEGDAGGSLTEAADALARAGRHTYCRTPVRTSGGVALRRAARMVAMLAAQSGNPEIQIQALVLALASLARAVADRRAAEGRLAQAASARLSAERLTSGPGLQRRDASGPGRRSEAVRYGWLTPRPSPAGEAGRPGASPRRDRDPRRGR